ncbi:MAG: hypothetical protein QOH91_676 [Mycobacterium sp.]|nr:hypothetical protein [Mycobacterium sp.]
MNQGCLAHANRVVRAVAEEAEAASDLTMMVYGHAAHSIVLAHQGQAAAAQAAAQSCWAAAEAMGGVAADTAAAVFAYAALAGGDAGAARQAAEEAFRHTNPMRETFTRSTTPPAEATLACGDLVAARRWADETVAAVPGWFQMCALTVRAFVAIAQNEPEQAERDARAALALAVRTQGYLRMADTLECLARLAAEEGNHPYAARLFGAAEGIRQRMGHARFPLYQAGYAATVTAVREALGQNDFDAVWAEGAALTTEEAIAYAQRGRGERKRPTTGWGSLTPMERDVVRLVAEGLGNKEIGTRLFVSPRTVQTHLTHVYAKLGLTSRVQLVQEAGRRT